MSNGGLDLNVLVVAMANIIADGQSKEDILLIIHLLNALQNALKSYIV